MLPESKGAAVLTLACKERHLKGDTIINKSVWTETLKPSYDKYLVMCKKKKKKNPQYFKLKI